MKKKKLFAILSWAAVAVCMGIIFFLSAQNGSESSSTSGKLMQLIELMKLPLTESFVRNAAHFSEFALLAVLIFNAVYQSCSRRRPFFSLTLAAAYAATDEFHQLFVEERVCSPLDWLIDCSGAACGILIGLLIMYIFSYLKRGKTN